MEYDMPTTTVNARATRQENNTVTLELERNGQTVDVTIYADMTLEEVAWQILAQTHPPEPDKTYQRQVTIEWHWETGVDPETQEEYQYKVIDDVTVEQLKDEAARDGFESLPGWATWTADEASDYIESNVNTLAEAKTVLKVMAQCLCYLRDWRR